MDFLTRQTKVIWTSPKGSVFNLNSLEGGYSRKHIGEIKTTPVSTKKGKKASTKKITESSDTFGDSGVGGRSISQNFLFVGDNHDLEAQKFCNALCEKGKSVLKLHYGDEIGVNVLDFSSKYSTVEKINLTEVSVNFHETSRTTYPNGSKSNAKQVQNAANKTNLALAQNISDIVDSINDTEIMTSVNSGFLSALNKISNALDTINTATLDGIVKDLEAQSFTKNAFTMAFQVQKVFEKALRATIKVKNLNHLTSKSSFTFMCQTGQSLINELFSIGSFFGTKLNRKQVSALAMADTLAQSLLTAFSTSVFDSEFLTRKEAINAAVALVELNETRVNFIDEQKDKIEDLEDFFICDSGINELIYSTANAIIEDSFNLKVERTIVLADDEATVNLAYKYYPEDFEEDADEAVKYFIDTNSLKDEEFFMLKRGSKIKIYV